jgi:hypothetical protein
VQPIWAMHCGVIPLQAAFSRDPGNGIFEQFLPVVIEAIGGDVTLNGAIAMATDWPDKVKAAIATRQRRNIPNTDSRMVAVSEKVNARRARLVSHFEICGPYKPRISKWDTTQTFVRLRPCRPSSTALKCAASPTLNTNTNSCFERYNEPMPAFDLFQTQMLSSAP